MRRLLLALVPALAVVAALAAPASASSCLNVPDLNGHVWTVCH